jgi:hypothetical protein
VNESRETTSTSMLSAVVDVCSPLIANASVTASAPAPERLKRSISSSGAEGLGSERQRPVEHVHPQQRLGEPADEIGGTA